MSFLSNFFKSNQASDASSGDNTLTVSNGLNSVGHLSSCNCGVCQNMAIAGHSMGCSCPLCIFGAQSSMFAPGQGLLSGYQTLSQEEAKELQELQAQREAETKQAKLEVFKKVPAELRQRVIDELVWAKKVEEINAAAVEKSNREIELENRNSIRSFISSGVTSMGWPPTYARYSFPIGLTADDLINAHNDACMEEAIQRGDDGDKN